MPNRSLLSRIISPRVPWWIALPCNVLAGIAIVLLAINPAANIAAAIGLLVPAVVLLYGTVIVRAMNKDRQQQT